MKKIINGRLYDTESAKELFGCTHHTRRDFNFWAETLYVKKTGEYFLYGEGGPMTKYARQIEQNSWTDGEDIEPLTEAEARKWAEENLDADEYIEIFGEPEE